MNLPLQMHAVSRGFSPKPRADRLSGGVVPSFIFQCDAGLSACSCVGNNSVACCTPGTCSCNGGIPGCTGVGGPPRDNTYEYVDGAMGHCHDNPMINGYCSDATDIRCFNVKEHARKCGDPPGA